MKKNVFKNLTDAFAAVATVFALAIVFFAYKDFEPTEEILKFYKVPETAVYIGAAIAFAVSFAANVASRRAPFIGLAFSLLPVWYLMTCNAQGVLKGDNPIAYLLFALVHFAGAAVYTVQWFLDRENDFSRAVCCAASASALASLHLAVCSLARFDPLYRYSFFYLRAGIIACAVVCSLFGLWRALGIKDVRQKLSALITVGIGGTLALGVWAFEFIF